MHSQPPVATVPARSTHLHACSRENGAVTLLRIRRFITAIFALLDPIVRRRHRRRKRAVESRLFEMFDRRRSMQRRPNGQWRRRFVSASERCRRQSAPASASQRHDNQKTRNVNSLVFHTYLLGLMFEVDKRWAISDWTLRGLKTSSVIM